MSDERKELLDLVRGVRAAIEWRRRGGAYAAFAGGDISGPDAEGAGRGITAEGADPGISAEGAGPEISREIGALATVREELGDCRRCGLADTRDQIVFGTGSETASLMFIGEAPGAEEDRRGEPFVGRAGALLDKMIIAMGWSRDTVYIANVLKCRPPGNRDPRPEEVEQCEPFLVQQIETIAPKIIVTLGKPAAHLVLKTRAPISALRGDFHDYQGTPVMPTFHPAYLLRNPEKKRETWGDLQAVMAEMERLGIRSPHSPR